MLRNLRRWWSNQDTKCKFGFHKWGKWEPYGILQERFCRNCNRRQITNCG